MKTQKKSPEQIAITLIIILGIIISLVQFLYNRNIAHDEAALALSIINRDACGLLKPLDYAQVAPILFLQIEKLFSIIWPNSECGLRLFPLLCFWASIFLFYQIVRKLISDIYAKIVAISFFAFGYMFVYYSSEVKQYMADVFVLLSMFSIVLHTYKNEVKKYCILAITGAIAVFLSNVAPVILFTCGVYLFYDEFFATKRKKIVPLLIVSFTWLGTFLLYYCLFIYEHPTENVMVKYWFELRGFLPSNPFTIDFYKFLVKTVPVRVFSSLFFVNYEQNIWIRRFAVYSMMFLFIAGIIKLIRNKQVKTVIFTCTPLLLHLFLSAFQLYPFERRLILYTIPGIITVCAFGFSYALNIIFPRLRMEKFRYFVAIIAVSTVCLSLFVKFPLKNTETKECIKYMQKNIKTSENVYCFLSALPVFQYYNDIGFVDNGINRISDKKVKDIADYMVNGEYLCSEQYIYDLKTQLHNKVWLLIGLIDNREYITGRLDSLGYKRIDEFKAKGASVYLYDFGE